MLKLTDLADKIAPHLIGISTPFGGALAKNYIGANLDDPGTETVPTGDDLDKVKADVQGDINKNNQEIANLKNEMENVGFKVMSHIPDLANGSDLDVSTIKDPLTSITTYDIRQKNGTSDPYIALDAPVTQTTPLMLDDNPQPCQIQIKLEVHDYPTNAAVPWYYFHFTPYAKITAIRVKFNDIIVNSFNQGGNSVTGLISEGLQIPLNSSVAHFGSYYNRTWLSSPQSTLTSPPAKVDYTDPRDGKSYNDTPAMMAFIPYGNWDAKDNNGSWSITQGSTDGGLYIAVYKGPCICYDLEVGNGPVQGSWTKRYGHYASGYAISTYGLTANYVGPDGQDTISYK